MSDSKTEELKLVWKHYRSAALGYMLAGVIVFVGLIALAQLVS